ncbi:inner centromere protein [Diachasma alloeum]|uniref:inner centromere protein n=1 Tax=Diachasma alloeum TaxID=454923 RepID=UPI0007381449|nr:inner centromere protein [Diachasma alloeum]
MKYEATFENILLIMDRDMAEAAINIIRNDSEILQKKHVEIIKCLAEREASELEFLRSIVAQIPSEASGPLMPKTPKAPKRPLQRIKTIPEDDIMNDSAHVVEKSESEEEVKPTRARRAASQKATESIKKQQSLTLNTKLRRPSHEEDVIGEAIKNQAARSSRSKRPMTSLSGSEEDDRPPPKVAKTGKQDSKRRPKKIKEEPASEKDSSPEKTGPPTPPVRLTRSSNPTPQEPPNKTPIIIDETLELPENDTITDPSLYEDAVGKSIPMNSTMNPNTTMTIDRKMMNATVVLEKINETITIKKSSINSQPTSQKTSLQSVPMISPVVALESVLTQPKRTLQNKLAALKASLANQEFDAILTDDESSPERKGLPKKPKRLPEKLKKPRKVSSSEEESPSTPQKIPRTDSKSKPLRDLKYKSNALFSPYAKESVKRKVEAFEQAVQNSPKQDMDPPTRVTRTKTRAMAAAAVEEVPHVQTLAQKLARKSLAKAKKISLTRQKRENDESKENLLASATKTKYFPMPNEKLTIKQSQRTTPISKSRMQMPMSVNRIHHTPASHIPPPKSVTASKAHGVGSTESLVASKPLSKSGSMDSLAEKKRLAEEDARKKKEENLKALSEEKKRKREEKELKNKMAREARERLEQQRRLQLEREREDKARQALIAQEKMKEEAERKKLAQLQRAQEKEERRRQEEMMRIQKIQEQEEAERALAEQKRKEQEAERKRLIEARNQQMAALEALKLKAHMMAKAKQRVEQKMQEPQAYVLDSDPDDDESDDESRPKHPIPQWARVDVRRGQLDMQQFIPMEIVLKFFGAKKCTPDLSELFVGIKTERLKRTSSANWKAAPRFSMMEAIED